MLSIILTGAALIREREHGTIEHLLVMPVTPFEIMVSKIWSMGLVVLLASAVSLLVVVQGVLAVPMQGSMALFVLGVVLHLFATTCMGIFLATVAGTMPQFGLLLMLIAAAAAGAVRRPDAARKHAGDHPGHHAAGAQHPLRDAGAVDPVSRRRPRRGVAATGWRC